MLLGRMLGGLTGVVLHQGQWSTPSTSRLRSGIQYQSRLGGTTRAGITKHSPGPSRGRSRSCPSCRPSKTATSCRFQAEAKVGAGATRRPEVAEGVLDLLSADAPPPFFPEAAVQQKAVGAEEAAAEDLDQTDVASLTTSAPPPPPRIGTSFRRTPNVHDGLGQGPAIPLQKVLVAPSEVVHDHPLLGLPMHMKWFRELTGGEEGAPNKHPTHGRPP